MEQELWEQGSGLPVALPVLPARLILPPHRQGDGNPLSQQDPEPHSPRAAPAALGGPREEMPLHCGWNGTSSAAGLGLQMLDYIRHAHFPALEHSPSALGQNLAKGTFLLLRRWKEKGTGLAGR